MAMHVRLSVICLAGACHHLPCGSERSASGSQYCTRPHCHHPRSRLHQSPGRHHRTRPYLCCSSLSLGGELLTFSGNHLRRYSSGRLLLYV